MSDKDEKDGIGVNPEAAQQGGSESLDAASRLKDLPTDFDEAIQSAKGYVSPAPGVTGWDSFSEEHVQHMIVVRDHAKTLANNIQDGAQEAASTDQETGDGFSIPMNQAQPY